MTIIWADWGDSDTRKLQRLWEGVPNVNLVHITKRWNSVMERAVDLAIANEKDTLLFCGHGSSYGLFVPNSLTEYAIHQMNANLIQAQRVVGIMCYGAEFAQRVGLHGLFSSMFISNVNEAVDYSIITTRDTIHSTNDVIFGIISEYLVGNLTDEECLYKLRCESSTNEVAMFNANSVQFV